MPAVKATIADVASLAGVSIKTVSRVINNEANVRVATKKKVEAAILQTRYQPNLAARNLASSRSNLIVLIYDDPSAYAVPSSSYILSMQAGALRACRRGGNDLLIHPCDYRDPNTPDELRALLGRSRPDGIVLAAPLSNMPSVVDTIIETGIPLVRLSPGSSHRPTQFSVETDDRAVCAKMTTYLISLQHRRIAFITGDDLHEAVANRYLGYQDGLASAGLKPDKLLVAAGDSSIGSGEACAEQLLALKKRPTAIFAANDDMAAGVIRAAHKHGIDVPKELSVVGFDDEPLAQQIFPSLTSIRQPLADMAERAVAHLISRDAPQSGSELVPSTIVVRESTGPAILSG